MRRMLLQKKQTKKNRYLRCLQHCFNTTYQFSVILQTTLLSTRTLNLLCGKATTIFKIQANCWFIMSQKFFT